MLVQKIAYRTAFITSLLQLSFPIYAADCITLRNFVGTEGIYANSSQSIWDLNQEAFSNNYQANFYLTLSGRCELTPTLSAKATITGQYSIASKSKGYLDDERRSGLGIINEATISWTVNDNLYLDIGKLRRKKGYLFSASPQDLLSNIQASPRTAKVNVLGGKWRDFYDEGSLGLAATLYNEAGTFDVVVLPRLTRKRPYHKPALDWKILERTNSTNRYYFSYSGTGLNDFNPSISLLLGDQKTLSWGVSKNVTDQLIMSLEGAFHYGERWRHLSRQAAQTISEYGVVNDPFQRNKKRLGVDLGINLRYTAENRVEYGIEYYGQSQGYSRQEWQRYYKTLHFVNKGYADPFTAGQLPPNLANSYQDYAKLMAVEADNNSRASYLQGKHYLTLYAGSNHNDIKKLDWRVSATTNLSDHSSMFNLHTNTYLTKNLEIYLGASYSTGKKNSEFGLFGHKGTYYAGLRLIW